MIINHFLIKSFGFIKYTNIVFLIIPIIIIIIIILIKIKNYFNSMTLNFFQNLHLVNLFNKFFRLQDYFIHFIFIIKFNFGFIIIH